MNMKWMLVAGTLLGAAGAVAAESGSISRTVPIGAQDRVSISNMAGRVAISTWDRPEVSVEGTFGRKVERVDIQSQKGLVDIRVVIDEEDWNARSAWRDAYANLQIRLPAGVQLEASTVSAEIDVSGVQGRTRLKSVSGGIRSDLAGPDLEASSVSGGLYLAGGGKALRLRANTVSGSIELTRVAGDIEARATSGSLNISAESATDIRAHSVSGGIELRGSLARDGNVEAQSLSGSVRVNAQAPAGFRYEAASFSGSVRSCFGQDERRNERGRGERIDGVRGDGQATVRAKTHSGSIVICDK